MTVKWIILNGIPNLGTFGKVQCVKTVNLTLLLIIYVIVHLKFWRPTDVPSIAIFSQYTAFEHY